MIAVGIVLAAAICLLWFRKQKNRPRAGEAAIPTDSEKVGSDSPDKQIDAVGTSGVPGLSCPAGAPEFATIQKKPWMLADLLRGLLILLSLVAAGVLALILLPQPALDSVVQDLQARHQVDNPEKIAFLYLGDEIANNQMYIRGVVRNITALPIENLDAIVRFYGHDRILLETTLVRMSKAVIGPGEIAQFALVYPNYRNEFASYSIEFKLRQGLIVPYKDMRAMRARSE